MKTLIETNYDFPRQTGVYHGKVRDVYFIGEKLLVMIASDRISAFDVILPKGIPYKGQVLNQIAEYFLDATADIITNWKINVPDPMATLGHLCKPLKVEVIVRGYLAGSAWREYKEGKREFGGLLLPDGYKENQRLPYPVVTPTTKEDSGHDQNITREQIVAQGIVEKDIYEKVHQTALRLFERGQGMAEERGLILVDTKYEFGLLDGKLMLIDEIHTPDSSRYFYADGYQERFDKGEKQQQLSKEFVRQWLIDHDFMGLEGQKVPEMTDQFCEDVSRRYIELYEKVTGKKFIPAEEGEDISKRIFCNVSSEIEKLEK